MSEAIRVGEHYEITLRGRWNGAYATTTDDIGDLALNNEYESDDSDVVSVKKIEPPVEVFGPGAVVRSKEFPSQTFVLSTEGFVKVGDGGFRKYGGLFRQPNGFTSRDFEKVELPA